MENKYSIICLCLIFCFVVLIDGNPSRKNPDEDVIEVNQQSIDLPNEKPIQPKSNQKSTDLPNEKPKHPKSEKQLVDSPNDKRKHSKSIQQSVVSQNEKLKHRKFNQHLKRSANKKVKRSKSKRSRKSKAARQKEEDAEKDEEVAVEKNDAQSEEKDDKIPLNNERKVAQAPQEKENCWLDIDAVKHFEIMDRLDEKHLQVRKDFAMAVQERNLDSEMLQMMLQTHAAADRAVHNAGGMPARIPAGINLGGYGMMKVEKALLFFHRIKLRNNTIFRVDYLQNDIFNMIVTARLSLNDLLLFGSYERAIAEYDSLFYRPTFGELEILLKGVTYKMEGRLRLVQSRLIVEHVVSEMHMKDILMMYYVNGSTTCQTSENIQPSAIADFLERLKADLDMWLKDYFNDYLLYFGLSDAAANHELHCYDKQKTLYLNDFIDSAIKIMHKKLHSLKPPAGDIKIPSFTIYTINGIQIRLHSGVIRGFDSFYRQSVATGRKENQLRMADAVIAFSKLKIEFKYLAKLSGRSPPMMGLFSLSADDLIAHLGVTVVKDPIALDLIVNFLRSNRPQTLVIEGAINRMVGNYRHILETEIVALMMNSLIYHIRLLGTLTRCEPNIKGHQDEGDDSSGDGREDEIIKNKNGDGPDFGVQRNDSIELRVPGDYAHHAKKMHIKYQENFELREELDPDGETITRRPEDLPKDVIHVAKSSEEKRN